MFQIFVIIFLLLGTFGAVYAMPKKSKEVTYYLMALTEVPDSKPFGCGEFLVPVKKKVKKADLKTALNEFFKAHATSVHYIEGYKNGPAPDDKNLYGFNFFALEKVVEPKKPTPSKPIQIFLKKSGKAEIGGFCDDPRAIEPLKETIHTYLASKGNPPAKIFLDRSESEWRCFGDASGLCK
jgi:hypothetical protein